MPVNTLSAAVHITPTVIKTFVKHSKRKGKKIKNGDLSEEATDDLVFDEAFHIVKSFILLGTKNTVESLQAFTNTHVPSPFWCAVSPVSIPLTTANRAADILIEWFGPEELKYVVGGERWWQVRGLDGIDAEWITEREYLGPLNVTTEDERMLSDTDKDILRMEELDTVMLYVHGGGYYWGSINTHRYQIIRYARKFKGRAFAVNYRKAPQYPWPCPLQDVIAAYLYLIDPAPSAIHKAIPPSKIVFAGDSAGGGLCLAVLTVLRDIGLPLPAGAVLISPWVDLTHSFPSVMENTKTDIMPPHGFLSKPSESWPVELIKDDGRVAPTTRGPPPKPGHADTLLPSAERFEAETKDVSEDQNSRGNLKPQQEMLANSNNLSSDREKEIAETKAGFNGQSAASTSGSSNNRSVPELHDIDFWQPKPPKVLMNDPRAVPLELRAQIHMYATTEQLSHPLVSPILQGSLGNLCPLYIIAGDGEMLRDEVIYLAHRAAHPDKFPVREGILRDGRRQKENKEKFRQPTKVHLQSYDGMCHVLTVFTFSKSAKYAYRSIAEFVKHVTRHPAEHLERNPFPELSSTHVELDSDGRHEATSNAKSMATNITKSLPEEPKHTGSHKSDLGLYEENKRKVSEEAKADQTDSIHKSQNARSEDTNGKQKNIPNVLMIRQRVDIHGKVRPMEPMEELSVLKMRPQEIGIIKEGPLNMWWSGQKECDKKYKRCAERAMKKRRANKEKANKLIQNARDQGLLLIHETHPPPPTRLVSNMSTLSTKLIGKIDSDRRWGPLDLNHENVPPSAIAKRRDTREALALLKKSIYHTAPITHQTVPKRKIVDIILATFDPNDDPMRQPRQSVSEQQVRTRIIPGGMHGLRVWDALLRIFMRESSKKAKNSTKNAAETILGINETNGK